MAEHRPILTSNFSSHHLDISRRLPLTSSNGNAQYHTLASAGIYDDHKGMQPRAEYVPTTFVPTLPSQPAIQHHASALEIRKHHNRNQRTHRSRNPIIDSQNYQNYRSRQKDEDTDPDKTWPDDLEDLFLEALLEVPYMGRRKFSVDGKPNGRNEIIAKYLWIGHQASLAPGQPPDPGKKRTRKQVSSHIQVLKGFMLNHPAFNRLFPTKDPNSRNGFEDSFKNNPCLIAIAQGRLPHRRPNQFEYSRPMRPSFFKMWMTKHRPSLDFKAFSPEEEKDLTTTVHTYTESAPKSLSRDTLENLPGWRAKFPSLAKLHEIDDLKCDIIHMEVLLQLRNGRPDGTELWGTSQVLVPGERDPQMKWRCIQSLYKPSALYGPPKEDPLFENEISDLMVREYQQGVGTHLQVSFPANSWAHIISSLSYMEEEFEAAARGKGPYPTYSARQYIDQITMYQVLESRSHVTQPWARKIIVLWTFRKCKTGERAESTWRYLDPAPARLTAFSPHPGPAHAITAAMTENFNNWNDTKPLLHPTGGYDPLMHELSTPPNIIQSPFPLYGYVNTQQDLPTENLSFASHDTQDSDSTLVDQSNNHMDSFLSTAGVPLGDFDHPSSLWPAPSDGFDNDPDLFASYNPGTANGSQIWDGGEVKQQQSWDSRDGNKQNSWEHDVPSFTDFDSNLSHAAGSRNHSFQDNQIDLILLEQQNKKRLIVARQDQDRGGVPREGPGVPGPMGQSFQGRD